MSVNFTDPPPLITECPNCQTRFRVGQSQLQIAHGRVRCGACLAVFAGVDHLVLDESAPPPELPAQADGLESVLAELDGPPQDPPAETADESEETADWTSVSVDTQQFGVNTTQEEVPESVTEEEEAAEFADAGPESSSAEEPRASISDALTDEEALRWWLEDELPGAVDSGIFAGKPDGEEMVLQLSQLDAVQEEELDLKKLVGTGNDNSSARALEELFEEELDEEERVEQERVEEDPAEEATPGDTEDVTSADEVPQNNDDAELEPAAEPAEPAEAEAEDSAQDDAEPLRSRAMANGTIAAAAERMTGALERAEKPTTQAPLAEKGGAGPVALVESPHQPARSKVPVPSPEADADVSASGSAEPSTSARVWDSTDFSETPADLVADITEEMAAAGQAPVVEEPSIFERGKAQLDHFLGHAVALRVATLFAFVVLTGQILYWQFADWSKTETMRPVYSGLCTVLGCELPARRSLRDLQSRKLAVRSHPDKQGALLVDALIINEANFEQPFPVIELQFMDMSQEIVGAYRLEPVTYLDGELAGSDALMAVRTPVHIDIDIPDPGPKAVNYQLQFR